jgi:ABC-type Fe3+-siderophore transport system permease subunit
VMKLFAGTGEVDARALDVNVDVDVLRWVLSGLAAMIAAQVSVSGGVGWVRLIAPHRARWFGPTAAVCCRRRSFLAASTTWR